MKERVVVAMSGGVDSSVTACLLKERGFEVIGITMCLGLADSIRKKPSCCGIQGIEDARRVAHKLGIKHYVLNMQDVLEEKVINNFCKEYLEARTPNPCVRCNQYLKFGVLLKKMFSLDARFLATGHYARIEKNQNYALKKAKDKIKDQSYFLYRLGKVQLRHILFPLGNYTKDSIRNLARRFDLPVADKIASQEICFLPEEDYRSFLSARIGKKLKPGNIVDKNGNILGLHKGIAYYTIGQRQGLGIAKGYPLYINKLDPKNNQITAGKKEDCFKKEFFVKKAHFISGPIKKKILARVKIRYNQKEKPAEILPFRNRLKIMFKESQFAITPGQSAVFYKKDTVLGGGIIDEVLA
jgi:tRNA-specific 2-thiouridylase